VVAGGRSGRIVSAPAKQLIGVSATEVTVDEVSAFGRSIRQGLTAAAHVLVENEEGKTHRRQTEDN